MAKQRGSRQGFLALLICMAGVSTSPLFYRLAFVGGMSALWVNVFRLLVTTLVMLLIVLSNAARRRALWQTSGRSLWISALAGTFLALHLNSWALSLVYTDAFAASTILGTYVLITALFSSVFLKEKTSKAALIGLFIATAGVVVCNFGGGGFGRIGGNLLAIFAAVTEALYLLCGRKAREEMSAASYTTVLYTVTLFWMAVMALFTGVPASFPADSVFWAGMLAVFSTLFGHSMASVALKYFQATTVSALMMSGMVVGPLLVLMVMKENLSFFSVLGGLIITFGLVWYMAAERREAKILRQSAQDSIL